MRADGKYVLYVVRVCGDNFGIVARFPVATIGSVLGLIRTLSTVFPRTIPSRCSSNRAWLIPWRPPPSPSPPARNNRHRLIITARPRALSQARNSPHYVCRITAPLFTVRMQFSRFKLAACAQIWCRTRKVRYLFSRRIHARGSYF